MALPILCSLSRRYLPWQSAGEALLFDFGAEGCGHGALLVGGPAEFGGHEGGDFGDDFQALVAVFEGDRGATGEDVEGREGHFVAAGVDDFGADIGQVADQARAKGGILLDEAEDCAGVSAVAAAKMGEYEAVQAESRAPGREVALVVAPVGAAVQGQA